MTTEIQQIVSKLDAIEEELALMYYFIIKGSNLENMQNIKWEDIKQSRLSKALELMADAKEETQELTQQRAKSVVEYMEAERMKI